MHICMVSKNFKHNFFNVPIKHTDNINSVPGRKTVCHGQSATALLYPLPMIFGCNRNSNSSQLYIAIITSTWVIEGMVLGRPWNMKKILN